MADDKNGREDQAQNAERRQRERAIAAELERSDEAEPPVDPSVLAFFESELEPVSFPATAAEVVAAVGETELETADGNYAVADLLPETDAERFESAAEVRARVQRPTVAAALKRVLEASERLSTPKLGGSQWEAYERTFEALVAIDADDDDEGVQVLGDWIVGRIEAKGKLPGSRALRKEAASFCRTNGYTVRDDEWLGA